MQWPNCFDGSSCALLKASHEWTPLSLIGVLFVYVCCPWRFVSEMFWFYSLKKSVCRLLCGWDSCPDCLRLPWFNWTRALPCFPSVMRLGDKRTVMSFSLEFGPDLWVFSICIVPYCISSRHHFLWSICVWISRSFCLEFLGISPRSGFRDEGLVEWFCLVKDCLSSIRNRAIFIFFVMVFILPQFLRH